MSSGGNSSSVLHLQELRFPLPEQLHLQPQHRLQQQERQQQQERLQYPYEGPQDAQSRQSQQQQLLQHQEDQHSQKQQQQVLKEQTEASQEQHQPQEPWQTQNLWQLQQQTCGVLSGQLPASPKQRQQRPNPLQQQHISLILPESSGNKMMFGGEDLVAALALEHRQGEHSGQMSWQQQRPVERWRPQEEQADRMPQPHHQQEQCRPQQQNPLSSSVCQPQTWEETEHTHISASLQECQHPTVTQKQQRLLHVPGFSSAQHHQQQAASEPHIQQQRQPDSFICMPRPSQDHFGKQQQQQPSKMQQQIIKTQQQPAKTQQQPSKASGKWQEQQQLQQLLAQQQRQQEFYIEQQQHQGKAYPASYSFAAADARKTKEAAGERLQQFAADMAPAANMSEAHSSERDWATFARPKQQQQQQYHHESGIRQQQHPEQCLLELQQQHQLREPIKQKNLLLDVPPMEPPILLECCERQHLLEQQPTVKQQPALQQKLASRQHTVEPLFEEDIFGAAAAAASASSGGSGESPVSPHDIPAAKVGVPDSQGEYFGQQLRQQMKKQLLQQDLHTQQAYLFSEQQQKLQLQPVLLEKEQQQHQTQLQQNLHAERLQQRTETVHLQQQQQHPQQHQQEQELDQQQKMLGNRCNALELFYQLGTANTGMPSHGAVASEQCEEVDLLSAADSLTTPARDAKFFSGSDSWMCWDSSSRRSSLYIEHKCETAAVAAMTFSSSTAENRDQTVSRCRHSSENSNSSSGCRRSGGHQNSKNFSTSSNASRGSPSCSSDVSSGCSRREGRIKCRYGSNKSSCEGWSGSHSAATPGVGAVLSESLSAFAGCCASAEAASQPADLSPRTRGFAADPSGGSRRGCEDRAETSCELLFDERAVHNSRNSSSRSRSCSQSSGWQSRTTNSRNSLCERNSDKCDIGQSSNCSEDVEINQSCVTRRRHRRRCRNSRTSGHSRSASFVSCRSRKRSSSHRNNEHSPSTGSCRNSRHSRRQDNSIEKTNIRQILAGTGHSCSPTSNSESHSSSPGEACELLAYGDSRSGRIKGRMINKETLSSRRQSSRSRKQRGLRASRRESSETKGGSSGGSKTTAKVLRNFNMLVDALAGEGDKKDADFALRVRGKVRRLPKLESQQRRRHQQEQHEEQQQHQQQNRRKQEQRQFQQTQALLVGRGVPYSSEGVWRSESVALQVLDQHARLASTQVDSGSSGSSRSGLSQLLAIESKSSDSSSTGGPNGSNRGSSESSCCSDRDDVADNSSESTGCNQQKKRSKSSSNSARKGRATWTRRRNERGISCCGPDQRTCFAGRCLQDMNSRGTATIRRADANHKQSRRSSSAGRSSGDRRSVTEGIKDICFGNMSGAENGSTSLLGNLLEAVQEQYTSSSRTTGEVIRSTHRRRPASSSCDSASLKQQMDMNSSGRGWNSADTPLTESHFTSKVELRNRQLRNSSSSCRAVLMQEQQRKAKYIRLNSEAEEEGKKIDRFKCWAFRTLDLLPEAWIGENVDAVGMMRQHGSSTYSRSETSCSRPEVSSKLSSKKSGPPLCLRVDGDVAVAATSPVTLPATVDVTVDAASGEKRTVRDVVASITAAAGSPIAASRELSSAAWDARTSGGAASPAVIGELEGPATASAAAAAEMRESVHLLQGYRKGEGAASVAEARNASQETVKAAIRQQLLQQYSSMLQQLQQHKAAAQLVQDESEPLRAALVHVVSAEAQLRKLQRSERWRLHVGTLIHDVDDDLMKFMTNFGAATDTFSLPVNKKATLLFQNGRGRRRRNVFSLEEEVVVEDEQQEEEKGDWTGQEEADQLYNEEANLSGLAWVFTPLLSLLVRDSNSNPASVNGTSCNGRKIRKNGNEPSTINRSRARLLLRFFLGYILLCGSVFLWLRHTIHQL